jgi:serine/threonine protein kinase
MQEAHREQQLFDQALDLATAGEREAFLRQACGDDAALLQRLQELLAAHEVTTAFLPQAPRRTIAVMPDELPSELPGAVIGRYKILERVGEGGCGVVYVAEQTEPVRRRVALKVIKLGMDTKQVVARFEAERQALAMMDHPNIAKVLDAGATELGRPYFVMELVRGIPITSYCDQNNLNTQARLDLFIKVCQAIQHAHQKGIIHRDIKPSNILVTVNDGQPVPKVIDFGIAKATEGRLTDSTVYTQLHQFIGTPAYMSPEQAEMTSLDVDTRADIYSLGVLLYELLSGRTPFEVKDLMAAGIDAMRRTIREKEPARPSTKLATLLGDELSTTAKRRSTLPPALVRQLAGDLDWITMKCLEKDRTRRYETANGLAADLVRHLTNEPVLARPPTTAYRFQKAIRRNKFAFMTAASVIATLTLGVVISSLQAKRAWQAEQLASTRLAQTEEARAESDAISRFMIEVFRSPSPSGDGRSVTAAEMLASAAMTLETDMKDQPARRATLQATLGQTYDALGLSREAIPLQEKARNHFLVTFGPDHTNTLKATVSLSRSYLGDGRQKEALQLAEEVRGLCTQLLGPEHEQTLAAKHLVALCYNDAGRSEEAVKLHEEVFTQRRKGLGAEHEDTLSVMGNLASTYKVVGREKEGLRLSEQALVLRRKVSGPEHYKTIELLNNVAVSYGGEGRVDEAIKMFEEVVTLSAKTSGPEHVATLSAKGNLAAHYGKAGRLAEALKTHQELLPLHQKVLGPDHPFTLATMQNLAFSSWRAGQWAKAMGLQEQLVPLYKKVRGPESPETLVAVTQLSTMYATVNRIDDATRLWKTQIEVLLKQDPNSQLTAAAYSGMGTMLDFVGRKNDAIQAWQETVRIDPAGTKGTQDTYYRLGKALTDYRRYAEALPILRATQRFFPDDERGRETAARIAKAEAALGLPTSESAKVAIDLLVTALESKVAADPTDMSTAMHLATIRYWLGETNGHRAICKLFLDAAVNSKDPRAHNRAAIACLIQVNPDPRTLNLAVASGRQVLRLASTNDPRWGWFLITAALAEVRDQKSAEAEVLLNESLAAPNPSLERLALARAYRALARARLGRLEEARADLAEMESLLPDLPTFLAPPALSNLLFNPDWVVAFLARDEARTLLISEPAPAR